MKISRHKDGQKAIEIQATETDDSLLALQGDTTVKAKDRVTGEESNVMGISQHGGVNFNQRPTVAGADIVTTDDQPYNLDSQTATVINDRVTTLTLVPVQPMVTVLYSLQGGAISETGSITISDLGNALNVSAEQHSDNAFADVSFSAREDNGSILLDISGYGTGEVLTMTYRVNAINTLYI